MSQYLLLFTIGPVQSFIAQARKTQDLFAGSYLLSYLTNFAIEELQKCSKNTEIIFPNKKIKSKPNRFIASMECEKAEDVGNNLETAVKGKFEKISLKILDNFEFNHPPGFYDDFKNQINDFLSIHWVALPFEKADYSKTFREIESYLGAVKNVRDFNQLIETGRKCSLCGERNVLFYKGNKKAYVYNAISFIHQPIKYLTEEENICGVCFTKRLGEIYFKNDTHYVKDYPSVAEISLRDSLAKIDAAKLKKYEDIFGGNFDSQLYYEENLKQKYFKKYGFPEAKLEAAKTCLKEIIKESNKKGIKLTKYYAIISLDGDSMGRWLSGHNLNDETQLLNFHMSLTEKLGSFSDEVEKTIKEPKGKLVYAGGDDVLAFVNLNHLLQCIGELREKFPKFETISQVSNNQTSSASCGICIAHYKTPLSEVLNWSRKMEKEAKSIDDNKDAIAIAVLKRSGEIQKTVFKWQYTNVKTVEILLYLLELLKSKNNTNLQDQPQLSDTFIKNLDNEFRRMMDSHGMYQENEIIMTEMKRLIIRSLTMKRKPDENNDDFIKRKNDQINDIVSKLKILLENSKSLENFISLLNIANFLENEVN